jgi:hypothetical protein
MVATAGNPLQLYGKLSYCGKPIHQGLFALTETASRTIPVAESHPNMGSHRETVMRNALVVSCAVDDEKPTSRY